MRPQQSTDYSGMTRQEAVQSMYGVSQKATPVGFQQGVTEIGLMVSTPFLMFGVPGMLGYAGYAAHGSKAYRYYGYAKYPTLSAGKHFGVRGASTALSLVKGYGKLQTAVGLIGYKKNIQLAQQREWTRLGINVFGPPGSLYMYDKYLADTSNSKQEETVLVEAIKEQSRRDGSLPSKSKTRGKDSYRPSATRYLAYYEGGVGDHEDSICRKGYRYDRKRNLCVRK